MLGRGNCCDTSARSDVRRRLLLALVLVLPLLAQAGHLPELTVNGQAVDRAYLEQTLGVSVAPGRYWYDRFTGWWGQEGQATQGSVAPGLRLGGPLSATASDGNSGVYFNGRQLGAAELARMAERIGRIPPGRYWLDANGVGGLEGGPAYFVLPPPRTSGWSSWENGSTASDTDWAGFRIFSE